MKNHEISMGNAAEVAPGGHLGAEGSQRGKKVPKMVLDFSAFELHFGTWRHFFRNIFQMFFWEVSLSLPGGFLEGKAAQQAPRME